MLTYRPPQSTAFPRRGVHPLTEDRLQFDGPRATYGRFRVLHQIGAGSVGPVFRGEDGETRDPVVIKVIRVGLPPEKVAVVASALAHLKDRLPAHRALTPLIDTGVVDVEPYLVSACIDGDSLDVALREFGPANMADALPRLRQLADAMDAAAAVGVAHGSLHLRDIVVSVGETVLTGMGIAAVLERVGVRPPVRRPYCAPEVALGHGISPAADQYALAAIAHEWLSGRRLSGSGAAGFQVPAVSTAGAEALHAVFTRAMDESPDGRYPTTTAFVEALAELAESAATRAKSSRRSPVVAEAPRFSFDEPTVSPGDPDDDVVASELPTRDEGADRDPLDSPLIVVPTAAAMAWEPEVVVPPGEVAGDEALQLGAEDPGPAVSTPAVVDESAFTVRDEEPADRSGGSSWASWAALLALVTVAALVGGWGLLRWSTPSSVAVSTPEPAEPADELSRPADAASGSPSVPPSTPPRAVPAVPEPTAATATPAPTRPANPPVAVESGGRPAPRQAPPPRAATAAPVAPRPAPARAVAPRADPAAPKVTGRLLVRSTPGGAEVFVNGERRGVTPLALRDLPFGAYTVRVARAGFAANDQRVVIDAGRPARSLEVVLTRAAAVTAGSADAGAPGSLLVESRPAGARVLVDGVAVGVTPLTVPTLAAGSHSVRIEHPGYAPITTTARVEARTRARVAVTLTAERPR